MGTITCCPSAVSWYHHVSQCSQWVPSLVVLPSRVGLVLLVGTIMCPNERSMTSRHSSHSQTRRATVWLRQEIIIIIIMYIYHALINALNAHMIHINLHMIFYTHMAATSCSQHNQWVDFVFCVSCECSLMNFSTRIQQLRICDRQVGRYLVSIVSFSIRMGEDLELPIWNSSGQSIVMKGKPVLQFLSIGSSPIYLSLYYSRGHNNHCFSNQDGTRINNNKSRWTFLSNPALKCRRKLIF